MTKLTQIEAAEAAKQLENATPQEVLKWGIEKFGSRLSLASSFGLEDVVLIDMFTKLDPKARVFTLDTGRLHQETYDVMDKIRDKYGISLEAYFPKNDAVEAIERDHGLNLFYKSPDLRILCCNVRKVEPLKRALSTVDAWITGLRREQNPTRAAIAKVEIDAGNGIVKLNPLSEWTQDQVWNYIKENEVPFNTLFNAGFTSIGCAPCTRPTKPGEDPRAGRWWWETSAAKECGLHCNAKKQ
jgi:thioredoxin-dependent adenylylsulfate APS reductase